MNEILFQTYQKEQALPENLQGQQVNSTHQKKTRL